MTTIEDVTFQDQALVPIWEKVLSGTRLGRDEGLSVLNTWDITALGKMADHVIQDGGLHMGKSKMTIVSPWW